MYRSANFWKTFDFHLCVDETFGLLVSLIGCYISNNDYWESFSPWMHRCRKRLSFLANDLLHNSQRYILAADVLPLDLSVVE